jgi:PAS domain S-box-containing protein
MRLPDGNGLELLSEVRRQGLPLAVVMLTGTGDEATALSALKAGADDYLIKSGDYLARLPATLESAVERHRTESARRSAPLRILLCAGIEEHSRRIRSHLATHARHLTVDVVTSTAQALAQLPTGPAESCAWDVLLLEIRLAGDKPLEVLKVLRADRGLDLPIVVLSGTGDEETVIQALRLGATDYMVTHETYLVALPAVLESAHSRVLLAREQNALRESQARLQAIIDSAMDAVISVDERQRVVLFNPAAERIFGCRREEALGQPLDRFVPERFRSSHRRLVADFAGGSAGARMTGLAGEVYGLREDGREFPIEASISRCRVGGQNLLTVILRDTTDRQSQLERLRESEEQFRQLAENIQEVFWMTDPTKNQMLYVSPAYEHIWGRTPDSLRADPRTWLDAIHPEDRERILEAALNRQTSGQYDEEYRIVRPDGSERRIHDRAFPVRDAHGRVYRVVGVAEDVTARREAEAERRQLEQQLLQSQKLEAIGRLAGGIAHDFNNMLGVILGNAELALKNPRRPVRKRLLEIQGAATRSADLTRQLLAFSRRQPITPRKLVLNEQIVGIERLLRRVIGEDIELRLSLASDLWSVSMDPSQIDQVLANLAVNSRDAMPDGGTLTVETANATLDEAYCRVHADAVPGEHVMLAVSDTGVGMDAATLQRAFEPFFTTKPEGEGSGLGLATVYGVARQNGGSVNIYSELGRGTTVKFYLPRHVADDEFQAPAPPLRRSRRGGGVVLLVEDEQSLREVGKELLEELGHTVIEASGGDEALDLCRARQGAIDILLTDVVMPTMNGRDLAEKVRELKPEIRVIYMSGYTAKAIENRGILEAGIPFLQKPFTLASLHDKITEVLRRGRAS